MYLPPVPPKPPFPPIPPSPGIEGSKGILGKPGIILGMPAEPPCAMAMAACGLMPFIMPVCIICIMLIIFGMGG